jgi:hypothetical protein
VTVTVSAHHRTQVGSCKLPPYPWGPAKPSPSSHHEPHGLFDEEREGFFPPAYSLVMVTFKLLSH